MTQVIVLCAGLGARLFPFSNVIPKSMMPVGGVPCIRWIVNRIKSQGYDDITIRVNKKFSALYEHEFRDMKVKLSIGGPHGTSGELLDMHRLGEIKGDFICYYGDELTPVDLNRLEKFHEYFKKPLVTLALIQGMRLDVGVVYINDEGKVTAFIEKPPLDKVIWAGICMMSERIFDAPWLKYKEDLAKDVFMKMVLKKQDIRGVVLGTEWHDVGSISHWTRVNKLAKEGKLFE